MSIRCRSLSLSDLEETRTRTGPSLGCVASTGKAHAVGECRQTSSGELVYAQGEPPSDIFTFSTAR